MSLRVLPTRSAGTFASDPYSIDLVADVADEHGAAMDRFPR